MEEAVGHGTCRLGGRTNGATETVTLAVVLSRGAHRIRVTALGSSCTSTPDESGEATRTSRVLAGRRRQDGAAARAWRRSATRSAGSSMPQLSLTRSAGTAATESSTD